MLVLTRKLGDRIFVGDDICITVVGVERGKVRIGIEAPKAVGIRRGELPIAKDQAAETTEPILVAMT